MRKLSVLAVMIVLCVLVGTVMAVAQLRDANTLLRGFPEDVVRIGSPFPDDDDEGDDEGCDCPPYPAMVPRDCASAQVGVPWPEPRFRDNGDGTVTDLLTGLIWTRDGTCYEDVPQNATGFVVGSLASGTCGLTDGSLPGDWRMPNLLEMLSLIDWCEEGPALPYGHPFLTIYHVEPGPFGDEVDYGEYWTSTEVICIGGLGCAYVSVDLFDGLPRWGSYQSHPLDIWPVRGPE